MEIVKSLGNGLLTKTESVLIYKCPNDRQAKTTLIQFVNVTDSTVVLNAYKFNNNIQYTISPSNMVFPGRYMAQEIDFITMAPGDAIYAKSSVANSVTYVINGIEEPIQATR